MPEKKFKFLLAFDKIIILAVLIFTALITFLFYGKASENVSAVIESDGKLYGIYSLKDTEYEFDIKTKYGHNTVKISGGSLWVTDTDCPDKTELGHKISKSGQVIVCLPNRLVISITGEKSNVDGVTY